MICTGRESGERKRLGLGLGLISVLLSVQNT